MLTTKTSVRFAVITPALIYMLTTLERLSRELFGLPDEGLVITSGSDGTHMAGSKHYTGEALDLRSKSMNVTIRNGLIATLRRELGTQFTVLLEDARTPNQHIHIQVKKGRRFNPDALIDDANTTAIVKELRKRGRRDAASKLMFMHVGARNRRWRQRQRAGAARAGGEESDHGTGAVGHPGR